MKFMQITSVESITVFNTFPYHHRLRFLFAMLLDVTKFLWSLSNSSQCVTLSFHLNQVINLVLDQSLNWPLKSGFKPKLSLTLVLDLV